MTGRPFASWLAEQGYALIFDVASGGVVAANPTLDLTTEIIRRLQAGTAAAAPTAAPAPAPN